MASQWERLLKNQGTWQGSFTRFSPSGTQLADTPTEVCLKPVSKGDTMRQEIRKFPVGEAPQETVLEYRSLSRSLLFFEDGAFSQGSLQWSPVGEFGAELGLIYGGERLRLVLLYARQRQLGQLTLIREHLAGTEAASRPPLSPEQLVGTWRGEALTLYPDYRPADSYSTHLEVVHTGDALQQRLAWGERPAFESRGTIQGSTLRFQGPQPMTLLMLPGGASATFPTDIVSGQPLFLEAGWLIQPDLRQRLIRSYSPQGSWLHLTLVTERRLSSS